ncbi:MAG: hypothetical protein P8P74_16985 [Crocinitomicaceae bacterium]|nr:hypothetical protein [Crocinitomicaceae bacterium]
MKNLLTMLCTCFVGFTLMAQQEQYEGEISQSETNIQRYHLDYELVDYTFVNGDSTILNELNITGAFHARRYREDLVLTDIEHNVKILLYSEIRMRTARGLSIPDHSKKLNNQ